MKTKQNRTMKIIMILVLGVMFVVGMFYAVDIIADGRVLSWFEKKYVYYEGLTGADGIYSMQGHFDWEQLKVLLLVVASVNMIVWLILTIVVAQFYGKKVRKKAIESGKNQTVIEMSKLIYTYMSNEKDVVDIFPREYAEVAAQMAEIKSEMLHKEQILKEESTRKNDLITYLAHDLKTPLTSVIGYLSLLDEAPDMPIEQKAKYIHISLDKTLRLEKLTNEFFEITRYNLQQISLEKEMINLSYMLVQMTDEFYPVLKAHGNTIEIKMDEELNVFADPLRLARVFNNILKNAIAYSYSNTVIDIQAENKGDVVCISFKNKGKTIPKHKLDTIFEKFFRLDDARVTNTGGAGLGLAIAKEIVTLHGGTIIATSENENTAFVITLPKKC